MITAKILPFLFFGMVFYTRHVAVASDDIQWHFSIVKVDELTYLFKAEAHLPDRWRIPSLQSSGTGVATRFTFLDSPFVFFRGGISQSPDPKEFTDVRQGGKLLMHEGYVVFTRTIRRIPYLPLRVRGSVRYEACLNGEFMGPRTIKFDIEYTGPSQWRVPQKLEDKVAQTRL